MCNDGTGFYDTKTVLVCIKIVFKRVSDNSRHKRSEVYFIDVHLRCLIGKLYLQFGYLMKEDTRDVDGEIVRRLYKLKIINISREKFYLIV